MKLTGVAPLFVSLALLLPGCGPSTARKNWASQITGGGDFDRGKSALLKYGCVACHTVDGIQVSEALVGPPLTHMASRSYVAGMLENTPPNLMRWIQKPHAVNPKTAMPETGLSDADARDIASYLYSYK